jgi:hypothetical protein
LKKETRLISKLCKVISATKLKMLKKYDFFNALPYILDIET